jgi:aspartyl-tRNA(Asn)/glutamyl-tRNA(Gln) amidotransferase subunit B
MLHDESGGGQDSLVDLNRAGTPLLEIVSQPDITTADEAKAYLDEIRLLLREIGVSDCEMQEGSLRCDANISVHVPLNEKQWVYTSIIEIKNLNSISAVGQALEYEGKRHFAEYLNATDKSAVDIPKIAATVTNDEILRHTSPLSSEHSKVTAGWDDARGVTKVQRRKELASDYRYFPEPDLAPVVVDAAWLERTRAEMGELPAALRVRLAQQYSLSAYDAKVLTNKGRALAAYFEDVAAKCGDAKAASNWVTNQVLAALNEQKKDISEFTIGSAKLADLIAELKATGLNMQRAREVFARMLETGCGAKDAIEQLGFKVVSDTAALVEIVRRAIAANPKAVADFKKGKTKAADAIKGAVMRETKGMAKTEAVQQILMEELQKA